MQLPFLFCEGSKGRIPIHQSNKLSADVDASRLIAILSQIAISLLAQAQSSDLRTLLGAEGGVGAASSPTPTADLGGVVFGSKGDNEALL